VLLVGCSVCFQKNPIMARIGFVGLGNMGLYMARNLGKKFDHVTVFNRSKEKALQLAAAHPSITATDSLHEISEKSDIICCCLAPSSSSWKTILGIAKRSRFPLLGVSQQAVLDRSRWIVGSGSSGLRDY
jgi:UDP-N-acetylmuramoylalanine-D-glutamate ligase